MVRKRQSFSPQGDIVVVLFKAGNDVFYEVFLPFEGLDQ